MTEPYVLPAAGEDVYRNFVVPIPIAEARFVSAVELKPGTVRGIHHARIMLDRTTSARRLDAGGLVPGYDSRLADQARSPEGHFLGWAPGTVPSIEKGLAWRLEPGTDLVLKTHLVPRGTPESIQVAVGLFFTDRAAADQPVVLQLGSQTIDIPAGDSQHEVRDEYRLPVDVDVLAIYPHAHYLARTVSSVARLPDGTTRALIRIDDWDFNWQDEYRYAEPVRLPAGSRVFMRYVYDNSAHNRRNPNRVPRRVRFGPRATDEMAELMMQVRPVDAASCGRAVASMNGSGWRSTGGPRCRKGTDDQERNGRASRDGRVGVCRRHARGRLRRAGRAVLRGRRSPAGGGPGSR